MEDAHDEVGNAVLCLSEYGSEVPVRCYRDGAYTLVEFVDVIMALKKKRVERSYVKEKIITNVPSELQEALKDQLEERYLPESYCFRERVDIKDKGKPRVFQHTKQIYYKAGKEEKVVLYPDGVKLVVNWLRERYGSKHVYCAGDDVVKETESRKRQREDSDDDDDFVPPSVDWEALFKSPRFRDYVTSMFRLINYEPLIVSGIKERDEQVKARAAFEEEMAELKAKKEEIIDEIREAYIKMETIPAELEKAEEVQARVKQLKESCEFFSKYEEEMRKKSEAADQKYAAIKANLKYYKAKVAKHADQIAEFKEFDARFAEKQGALDELDRRIAAAKATETEIGTRIAAAKAEDARLSALLPKKTIAECQLMSKSRELDNMNKACDIVQAKLAALEKQRDEKEASYNTLRDQCWSAGNELKALKVLIEHHKDLGSAQ